MPWAFSEWTAAAADPRHKSGSRRFPTAPLPRAQCCPAPRSYSRTGIPDCSGWFCGRRSAPFPAGRNGTPGGNGCPRRQSTFGLRAFSTPESPPSARRFAARPPPQSARTPHRRFPAGARSAPRPPAVRQKTKTMPKRLIWKYSRCFLLCLPVRSGPRAGRGAVSSILHFSADAKCAACACGRILLPVSGRIDEKSFNPPEGECLCRLAPSSWRAARARACAR